MGANHEIGVFHIPNSSGVYVNLGNTPLLDCRHSLTG